MEWSFRGDSVSFQPVGDFATTGGPLEYTNSKSHDIRWRRCPVRCRTRGWEWNTSSAYCICGADRSSSPRRKDCYIDISHIISMQTTGYRHKTVQPPFSISPAGHLGFRRYRGARSPWEALELSIRGMDGFSFKFVCGNHLTWNEALGFPELQCWMPPLFGVANVCP